MASDAVTDDLSAEAGRRSERGTRRRPVEHLTWLGPTGQPCGELERRGLACEAGELWFATTAIAAAIEVVAGLLADSPDGFTVSEARQALGSTRSTWCRCWPTSTPSGSPAGGVTCALPAPYDGRDGSKSGR